MALLMKGHTFKARGHKLAYPAWAQIKYDEIRTHVIIDPQTWHVTYLSYAEKPLHNLDEFIPAWVALAKDTGIYEFDCGFEVNRSFNDTYRWVRSSKGLPTDMTVHGFRFILFDLPTVHDATFEIRLQVMQQVIASADPSLNMEIPQGFWVNSSDEVQALFVKVREQNVEGLMVKSLDHLYIRDTRSNGWLKVKPSDDADGVIEEVIEAISEAGVPLGRAGSVRIRCEDGSTATPHGIEHSLGRDMFTNPDKYIGQWAEFKYMERDRQGGYRHPTWGRLREAKS